MSESDDNLKRAALSYLRHQPFLHILLLAILAAVIGLAYLDKREYVADVLKVGCYSVVATLIGVLCSWSAPRVQAIVDSIPLMTAAYTELASGYRLLAQFVAAIQPDIQRTNMLLLIEDNSMDVVRVQAACVEVVREFHLSFRCVETLAEAVELIQRASVAIVDVILPDNTKPDAINRLMELCNCPVIIHTIDKYSTEDFPRAFAILRKNEDFDKLRDTVRRAVASTRFS